MVRIIIDDVEDVVDLLNALAAVQSAFTDPDAYSDEVRTFSKTPTGEPVAEIAGPAPYVPCRYRGTHLRLTDCWMCWCDVHRGACLATDVLHPDAWDIALAELLPADDNPEE